ncbi:hypothetical protein PWT90_08713 [Aphanocladium album]|nr:hypothetical protein PWT90_08713 [Aphanocladium album]
MDFETLDGAILAALPKNCKVLSVVQHGSTNASRLTWNEQWSTGLRADILDGEIEKSYFIKIIEREELVGMAEAEYEGQKAIHSVIPDNAVKPIAWGYFCDTKSKAWFMAEYLNLRARAPPLEQFLPIVKQMHQKSVSPTGKFGFHVTPFYGPPPMVVDWTDNWEEFWVREFRSGLKYVQTMRGNDPELGEVAEDFIQKVAARLLRPLQTGGRNIKPSLCHGDLWDGNIQFNVDTQQPIIFDPCSFYGHHEMDFQCMRSPRYIIGQNFIDLYKVKVGASQPSEDFEDRIALYSIRNDLMTAGMWPQWASLVDKAKDEMKRLIEKYPNGLRDFHGSLEPTTSKAGQESNEKLAANEADDSGHDETSSHPSIGSDGSKPEESRLSDTSKKNLNPISKSIDHTKVNAVEPRLDTFSNSQQHQTQAAIDSAEGDDPTATQSSSDDSKAAEDYPDKSSLRNATPTSHGVLESEDVAAASPKAAENDGQDRAALKASLAEQADADVSKNKSSKPASVLDSSLFAKVSDRNPIQATAEVTPKDSQSEAPRVKEADATHTSNKIWQLLDKLKLWT